MTRPSNVRVIAAGVIGNLLEWYDFAIYGFFAAQIGAAFFPAENKVAQVLAAFGVFAVGYVMRPLGGVVTGYIGDRLGRRAALTFSVSAMAIPTFLVGVLPGYETLGVMAPVLLTVLRAIQGLSVGGEYTTAMVFLIERAPPGRRGLIGAVSGCGADAGMLLGSGVGAGLAAMVSTDALAEWAWRLPFILGLFVGLAGFALRHGIEDSPVAGESQPPLLATVRGELPLLLRLAGLSVFLAVGFYLVFLYMVSWLQMADGISPEARAGDQHGEHIRSDTDLPVRRLAFGPHRTSDDHADRHGRCHPGLAAALLVAASSKHGDRPRRAVRLRAGGGLLLGNPAGGAGRSRSPQGRCTLVAIGYNIPLGIIGGLTPMAATWLVARTGDDLSPAYLMIAAALISTVALLFMPETFRRHFQSQPQPQQART